MKKSMKTLKITMSIICITMFITSIFSEPTKFKLLTWIAIAFMSVHTNYD